MTKIDSLAHRVARIGRTDDVPGWLSTVATPLEIAEYKAIVKSYRGLDLAERRRQFIKKLREKYGSAMPITFEEELERKVKELEADPELARREGLTDEEIQT